MNILILSPHMDDAFLSVGGTIAKFSGNNKIHILDIFSFDPWVLKEFDRLDKNLNISTRKKEERKNSSIVNVLLKFLNYPAGWEERGYSKWQTSVDARVDRHLIKEIKDKLILMAKEYTVVLAPLAIGGHVDHRLIRDITISMGVEDKICYYEDLPYALEENFIGYAKGFIKDHRLQPVNVELGNEFLSQKSRFVSTYKSQLNPTEMLLVMDYTYGRIPHRQVKNPSETLWTSGPFLQNNLWMEATP